MASFGGAIGSASFQEPSSPDTTSTPQIPDQQPMQQPTQGLAAALAKRKGKKGIGPTMKPPSTLAAAISKAKRARVGGDKYG